MIRTRTLTFAVDQGNDSENQHLILYQAYTTVYGRVFFCIQTARVWGWWERSDEIHIRFLIFMFHCLRWKKTCVTSVVASTFVAGGRVNGSSQWCDFGRLQGSRCCQCRVFILASLKVATRLMFSLFSMRITFRQHPRARREHPGRSRVWIQGNPVRAYLYRKRWRESAWKFTLIDSC